MDLGVSILANTFTTPWDLQTKKKNTNLSNNNVPKSFIWSLNDDIGEPKEKLDAPIIDLQGFIIGDETATKNAAQVIKNACSNHGFFQVINHGIDPKLLNEAYSNMDQFFKLPNTQKAKAAKVSGTLWGLSVAHADRLSTNLPWKETLSFPYRAKNDDDDDDDEESVVDYFTSVMGNEFEPMG